MKVMNVPTVMDRVSDGTGTGDVCQVVIYNDNHNTAEHVMQCLMSIFNHSSGLAKKIMLEAHTKGRAIAQVEDFEKALQHQVQLQSSGLKAEVESISTGL